MQRRNNKGFTLVEILIVVIILGILAAIVIPQFTNASNDARNNSVASTLQTLRGGNITLLTELCEQSRAEAFEIMIRHASDVGATGIVAVRYDATEVMSGVTEVLCYGTAVQVEPA